MTAADLLALLPAGRQNPLPVGEAARRLGLPRRTIQALAVELIEGCHLIGSVCGEHPGLFVIVDKRDLQVGTAHILARAVTSIRRVRRLRASAEAKFGEGILTLFDVEDVS